MSSFIYNPLHFNEIEIINNNFHSNIIDTLHNNLKEWCCPICFEDLNTNNLICIPFECSHVTCFKCFSKNCNYLFSMNKNPRINLKCSLCRSNTNINWNQSYKIYYKNFNYKKNKLIFVDIEE